MSNLSVCEAWSDNDWLPTIKWIKSVDNIFAAHLSVATGRNCHHGIKAIWSLILTHCTWLEFSIHLIVCSAVVIHWHMTQNRCNQMSAKNVKVLFKENVELQG